MDNVTPGGGNPRRDTTSLRRWVTFAGIALIALIVAADSYEAWQDYRRVIADNERTMVALSRALTEQTARLVQEVDVVLSGYAGWLTSAEGQAADERASIARLNAQIVSLPFVSSAAVIGADGMLRASTRMDADRDLSLRTADVFAVPAYAAKEALYVDRPSEGGTVDAQTFALSRRVGWPNGNLEGVVLARVAFDYLVAFYAGVNVAPDTGIRLARTDGVVLVQYPLPTDPPARGDAAARADTDQIRVRRNVGGYPIVVTVSRSAASVLKPWIQEERSSAARTLTLAVLAALLLLALRAALHHQELMDQERHRLEQELAGRQRVDALGLLAASVTHDFNNVLTAIIGYAELMRDAVVEEPVLGNLDRLLAATERARLLVRQVLTFDPHRSVSYHPREIEPLVVEVAQQVRATLPASIDLQVYGLEGSTSVLGDATEIHQVMMNLCSNAVHAMPSGGLLEVRLESLEVAAPETLLVGQLTAGRWVGLSVIDSGVGLAEAHTNSIFEPFYTTRPATHGTGIGLTVVRNILLRMNGALRVESRLGIGTHMTVFWPAVAPEPVATRLPAAQGGGTGETILVVDDERELVALTEELLASLSYEPVGFSDARAALEAFRLDPGRFDAILTDERMVPMRGLELARLIHLLGPQVPILLMTGHRDAEMDARAREVGVCEIIDKPLRVQTLREALGRHLRTRSDP